jgi:Dyp-type peroxidase family
MATHVAIRETPTPTPLVSAGKDVSHPAEPSNLRLEVSEIQGNILAGFSKDFQANIYLKIDNPKTFRAWLADIVPLIATTEEVLTFNRLFKALRTRQDRAPKIKATWTNIAFSYQGIKKIAEHIPGLLSVDFDDQAFKQGMAARSVGLGDETRNGKPGNANKWKVGAPGKEPDVILVVASDDAEDLKSEVTALLQSLKGAKRIAQDDGATLPASLHLQGHEHFGFLDGVSQPGVRGHVSDDPSDVLTPRQNPNDRGQGKPGQDLLLPGEFVFGYVQQDGKSEDLSVPGQVSAAGPVWAKNGSFLVFRRLNQDVFGFHTFLKTQAKPNGFKDGDEFGAHLVGRWKSGAPVLRTPLKDDSGLGHDDCANNNFEFQVSTPQIKKKETSADCLDDKFATSPGDKTGARCPFAGHIRKAYPRDDTSATIQGVKEATTQTHRLLRRGIPFGKASKSTPTKPVNDGKVDRGLLFLAYQTSIVNHFEFVTQKWVNDPDFKDTGAGFDPILGQNNSAPNRERQFKVINPAGQTKDVTTTADWVVPSGGEYFFAPSISALNLLAGVTGEES